MYQHVSEFIEVFNFYYLNTCKLIAICFVLEYFTVFFHKWQYVRQQIITYLREYHSVSFCIFCNCATHTPEHTYSTVIVATLALRSEEVSYVQVIQGGLISVVCINILARCLVPIMPAITYWCICVFIVLNTRG